ncbi:MAG: hypothetical protein PHT54_02535 [Candidatus Nanoarchaeia archaeon]|nr:hypothetical protein [Candidatus Nanoarchaeia archaeon]
MALFTVSELIGIVVLTIYLGYLFSGITIRRPGLDKKDFIFSILIAAPAVILHEFAHKFTAMAFGIPAVFHVFYEDLFTLILAGVSVLLKAIGSPIIFLIPGFVSIPSSITPPQSGLISFAGPFINLMLWIGSGLYLKYGKRLTRKKMIFLFVTKRVNMILFLFNMIPFYPLDGEKVLNALFSLF